MTFLLSLLKNPRILMGIGIVVILSALAIQCQRIKTLTAERDENKENWEDAVAIAQESNVKIIRYKNQYDQEVVKSQALSLSQENYKKLYESKSLEFSKQFGLNKKKNNVESLEEFDLSFSMENDPLLVVLEPIDSLEVYNKFSKKSLKLFQWSIHDKYNDLSATVLDTPKINIRVPIKASVLWERRKFLFLRIGKKDFFLESYSPNKLIRIDSQRLYLIRKPK